MYKYIISKEILVLFYLFSPLFSQETHSHQNEHRKVDTALVEVNKKYDAAWADWREKLFDLPLESGMQVGEVGAGKGELAILISRRIGKNGHIYANEIDRKKLEQIKELAAKEKQKNITPVMGKVGDPLFPAHNLDVSVMIEVFHHLEFPGEFLKALKKYLKPEARLYIIDPDVNQKNGTLNGCYSDPEAVKILTKNQGYNFVDLKWKTVLDLKFYILTVEVPCGS